jgi:hypothetical protein
MSIAGRIYNMSIFSASHRIHRYWQEKKYEHNAHAKIFNWDWSGKGFNRIALVNHLISMSGGLSSKYLEIGCDSNTLFHSVASLNKVGVDPAGGGTHRMTSDKFFSNNEEIFDVIFIDGLHEYEQVHQDAVNALKFVKTGGFIAFHDFLPSSWKEHHVPRISPAWTGDCWKLAVQLAESTGVQFVILDIDHGVGVMKKLTDDWFVPDVSEELKSAEFDKFVSLVDEFPIVTFEEGIKKIAQA